LQGVVAGVLPGVEAGEGERRRRLGGRRGAGGGTAGQQRGGREEEEAGAVHGGTGRREGSPPNPRRTWEVASHRRSLPFACTGGPPGLLCRFKADARPRPARPLP